MSLAMKTGYCKSNLNNDKIADWCRATANLEVHYFSDPVRRFISCIAIITPQAFIPDEVMLTKERIDLMYAWHGRVSGLSLTSGRRHIPCIAIHGRYDAICPVS